MTELDNDITPHDISNVLMSLLASGKMEDQRNLEKFVSHQASEHLLKEIQSGDYSAFRFGFMGKANSVASAILVKAYPNSSDARFIVRHQEYVEAQICGVITTREGSAYSMDKTRNIIRLLIQHFENGFEILFDPTRQASYAIPKVVFQSQEEIVDFYIGIRNMYYGRPEKYLVALSKLYIKDAMTPT